MPISSLANYKTLQSDLKEAIRDKAISLYRKYENGNVNIFDRLRFWLLYKYVKYVVNVQVYEDAKEIGPYVVGDIVNTVVGFHMCMRDGATPYGFIGYTPSFWSEVPEFTYDYDKIIDYLNKINRICGTNFTI